MSSKIASSSRAIYMAWITPPFFKEGDADADIAASMLGQGRVSRLYKKLEYEKQIAQNVNAYQYSTMLGSIFGIEATARPGRTLQELEAVINEEIEALRTKGPTAAEVDRARNVLETQIFNGLQLVGGFGGVADQLNLYNHYVGKPDYLTEDIMRRRRVTPESVRQFAQRYLAPNARVVVHGIPGKQNLGPEVPKPAEQAADERGADGFDQCRRAVACEAAGRRSGASRARARSAVVRAAKWADGALRCRRRVACRSCRRTSSCGAAATRIRSTSPGSRASPPPCSIRARQPASATAARRRSGADWRIAQHRDVARSPRPYRRAA